MNALVSWCVLQVRLLGAVVGAAVLIQGCAACDQSNLEIFGQQPQVDAGPSPPAVPTPQPVDGLFVYTPPLHPTLHAEHLSYPSGELVRVFFEDMASSGGETVVLARAGGPPEEILQERPTQGRSSGTVAFAAVVPGTYVARAFFNTPVVQAESVPFNVQPEACPLGQLRCDGRCVAVDSSLEHCGACHVACGDGNTCNGAEACRLGACMAGVPVDCDDGNPCTADACGANGCESPPAADGSVCAAGDVCHSGGVCVSGACSPGAPVVCDDGNPCTADACGANGCEHAPAADGSVCAAADLCHGGGVCVNGACPPGAPVVCDDGNPCTLDHCDPAAGCAYGMAPDGTTCPDALACNGEETCREGACRPGIAEVCADDGNPCTADACGPNGCEHPPLPDGHPCSDGQMCNGNELCLAGVCAAGAPAQCDDGNVCTTQRCDGEANRCAYAPVADGTLCDDGQTSTQGESCRAGICGEGRGTRRVSETVDGLDPNEKSEKPFLSQDGRFIAFQSESTNLIAGDTNGQIDVFVAPSAGGASVLVSSAADGTIGNNLSRLATPNHGLPGNAISLDGSRVAFTSLASNLVAGDTNNDWDVFVKDLQDGSVWRASVATGGGEVSRPADIERWEDAAVLSGEPALSHDGRYVAFSSYSTGLVAGDANALMDVFRHDLATGDTVLVSRSTTGAQGNGDSDMPSVSQDGRCVAFRTLAGNLNDDPTAPDTNFQYDIYVRDMAAGTTRRISMGFDGSQPDDVSYYPRLSADCSQVVWLSWATNLVPGDTDDTLDVFMRGVNGGPITRVTTNAAGQQGNLRTGGPATINQNGRYVSYYSWATNLVPDDNNTFCNYTVIVDSTNCIDVFVKDVWTGAVTRVSLTAAGAEAFNNNQDPSISGNGTSLAFGSYAANLDPDKTTGFQDIFFVYTGVAASP